MTSGLNFFFPKIVKIKGIIEGISFFSKKLIENLLQSKKKNKKKKQTVLEETKKIIFEIRNVYMGQKLDPKCKMFDIKRFFMVNFNSVIKIFIGKHIKWYSFAAAGLIYIWR